MRNVVFGVALCGLLGGCVVAPVKGSERVKIVDPSQAGALKPCRKLEVTRASYEGEARRHSATNEMRNDALKLGGNVVLSTLQGAVQMGAFGPAHQLRGVIYACPAAVLGGLQDMSEL